MQKIEHRRVWRNTQRRLQVVVISLAKLRGINAIFQNLLSRTYFHRIHAPNSSATKNHHQSESRIEQSKRISDQETHLRHAAHNAEHSGARIRAPSYRRAHQTVPKETVKRKHDTKQASKDQRQETVTQD